ncbi:hypothetical protein ASPWEDRAFT_168446 [Aspergillus wentii DTO 134E9]|uniref:C2H2-type domain-containing protein n=1 Tax=Aspergillus wentii DTO 134E9 TaxID=1073089 RepID=A0A1L9RUE4_ASPWE|nr:uncharacterized protein ASPWEDRAFT_168446 [Aspergillus wentii DTO 134E9]KAI9923553.1 hypothetical protein MW887_008562 [Aspergillus wentii]OJJ38542.1 hypothetical protein ASPWEDRAFT_168446 [Aspergillus wentii DTO 134E9]
METAEPVSYEFPGHAVGAVAPRRVINSNLGHNFFYPNPTASFPLPFQSSSSSGPYNFGHALNHHHHHQAQPQPPPQQHQQHHHHHQQAQPHHHQHPQHPGSYQHFFVSGQPQLNSQPVRLSSEPPPLQSIPDIRPAKNAVNRVPRDPLAKIDQGSGTQPSVQHLTNGAPARGKSPTAAEVDFSTEVDVLMKAIQAKVTSPQSQAATIPSLPSLQQLTTHPSSNAFPPAYSMGPSTSPRCALVVDEPPSQSRKKRKYTCTLPHCGKSFAQKTHLDIHTRAHTGDKPFICKEPSCGQRFSQLGNLKTHQRRHTGEKPFSCDICQKRFAQRGNVRAHKITHQHAKPFTCLLDDCGKQFTQLGNLKSHQNKFHSSTLRNLTLRFSQMTEADLMNTKDRELLEYFATLYKNSNKGIKGRGKDRRISPSTKSGPGRRFQSLGSDDDKIRRGSYEDSSTYTGVSSDDEDAENYNYWTRRAH